MQMTIFHSMYIEAPKCYISMQGTALLSVTSLESNLDLDLCSESCFETEISFKEMNKSLFISTTITQDVGIVFVWVFFFKDKN